MQQQPETYSNPTLSGLPPITGGMDNNYVQNGVDNDPKLQQRPLNLAGNPKKLSFSAQKNRVCAAGSNNPVTINSGTGRTQEVRYFDYNLQSMKKGVSSALLDVALLMANASQLKSLYLVGPDAPFYYVVGTLLIASLILQVIIGCVLLLLSKININDASEWEHRFSDVLNNIVVVGVFLLTIDNVFIAAIGISAPSAAKTALANKTTNST